MKIGSKECQEWERGGGGEGGRGGDSEECRAQFHQRSTYSFYTRRSQKRKKILMT
jgi:hypothetical protein